MSSISPGYVIGIVLFGAIVALCLYIAVFAWRDGERWTAGAGVVVAAVFVGIWFVANNPALDLEYHSYQQISGTVTEVERDNDVRMFELKDDPRNLECTESWCTKVEVGDTLTLNCIRSDGPTAANTWECEFIGLKETDRV